MWPLRAQKIKHVISQNYFYIHRKSLKQRDSAFVK